MASAPPSPAPLSDTAQRALRQFDAQGRLTRWPIKYSVQRLMLWGLWMRFDGKRRYSEREVNEVLKARHLFGDHCTLRRELVEMKMLERSDGGAEYRCRAARCRGDGADTERCASAAELWLRSSGSARGNTRARRSIPGCRPARCAPAPS
ncbi:DUF2087 domain-containing protein [Piscinibacter aquaticus]|uniref:DUF2087 domain-containing protein n=1 Tax=Piscinibacter aquaticus TaxID=392597 RepID=A0A5C6TZL8_9BURK|nr:DUF2087 domain-containing protein [Piscinibacter aquaticus]